MSPALDPTETTDREITVVVIGDQVGRNRIGCSSYEVAIDVVKDELSPGVVAKIENREGDIVFTSGEMSIDDW